MNRLFIKFRTSTLTEKADCDPILYFHHHIHGQHSVFGRKPANAINELIAPFVKT
jgi:hypothetical protein